MNYIIRRIFIQRMYHFIFIYAAEAYDHELFLCEKEFSFVHFFFGFRRISRSFPLSFFALIENQYPSSRILLDFLYGGTSNVI